MLLRLLTISNNLSLIVCKRLKLVALAYCFINTSNNGWINIKDPTEGVILSVAVNCIKQTNTSRFNMMKNITFCCLFIGISCSALPAEGTTDVSFDHLSLKAVIAIAYDDCKTEQVSCTKKLKQAIDLSRVISSSTINHICLSSDYGSVELQEFCDDTSSKLNVAHHQMLDIHDMRE